jgi:hypothetical protein
MNKKLLSIGVLLIGITITVVLNTGCEEDPKEACLQDEFCTLENDELKTVTTCCTDGEDCYYTYNGTNYPDTEQGRANLVEAMGCATVAKKSSNPEHEYDFVIARLEALVEEAKILSMN